MGVEYTKKSILRFFIHDSIYYLGIFRAENADLAEENTILRKENERLKVHLAELRRVFEMLLRS